MKKIIMLAAATIIGLSGIVVSQAEDVINTPVETSIPDAIDAKNASVDELLDKPMAAATDVEADPAAGDPNDGTPQQDGAAAEATAKAEAKAEAVDTVVVPKDSPQVQALIKLYPKLIERIHPYAKVCFSNEECDITLIAAGGSADGKPRDGKAVYDAVCQTCHASGLLGSPPFGDKGAWGPRIAKGKDTLYNHALHGFNAMPAKGGADIPDEEVKNAVDYMVKAGS